MESTAKPNKQPSVLCVLYLTEMWERFGFYIVQVLLIFYLINVYNYTDKYSDAVLGAFTGLAYITPVLGGYLADRFFGFRHAIILGGVLLSLGYALLSLQQNNLFYISLGVVAVGTGLFKPNISSYLGNFYYVKDNRRERGFTLFYMGISVGITLATLTSGYILRWFGWRSNFLVASCGLLLGIATFILGLYYLKATGRLNMTRQPKKREPTVATIILIYGLILLAIYVFSKLIQSVALANAAYLIGGTVMVLTLIFIAYRAGGNQFKKMGACLVLILFSVVFWALYFQLFFALNLFVARVLDRSVGGHILPTPLFISMESIFLLMLAPFMGWLWQNLERKNINPSFTMKFSLAMFAMACGLFILVLGTHNVNPAGLVNKYWIVASYLLVTIGELLISPISIAMVTLLTPLRFVGMMIGVYLAAIGFGAKLAGVLASLAAIPKATHSTSMMITIYGHAFFVYAQIAVVTGVIILLLRPFINGLIEKGTVVAENNSMRML